MNNVGLAAGDGVAVAVVVVMECCCCFGNGLPNINTTGSFRWERLILLLLILETVNLLLLMVFLLF